MRICCCLFNVCIHVFKVVDFRGGQPWVQFYSRKGAYWAQDLTQFVITTHDVLQILPVPDMILQGGRDLYDFAGPLKVRFSSLGCLHLKF